MNAAPDDASARVPCSDCGALRHVLVVSWLRIGSRVVQWRQCPACFTREARNAA